MSMRPWPNSQSARTVREYNQCHSPENGRFCSTEGGGGAGEGPLGPQLSPYAQRMRKLGFNVKSRGPRQPKAPEAPPTPEVQAEIDALPKLTISDLAYKIQSNWRSTSKKGVNFAAKPYLDAMKSMDKATDNYGADSGPSVIRYFLGNATSWKGHYAKAAKAELKKRIENKW